MNKEKIPLLLIFKEDGEIKTETSRDCKDFELLGFLKCYVDLFEKSMKDTIRPRDKDDDEELL